jgi:hypothetical protein
MRHISYPKAIVYTVPAAVSFFECRVQSQWLGDDSPRNISLEAMLVRPNWPASPSPKRRLEIRTSECSFLSMKKGARSARLASDFP